MRDTGYELRVACCSLLIIDYWRLKDSNLSVNRVGYLSGKLFCKHSQVTFMPYGVVLNCKASAFPAVDGAQRKSRLSGLRG